MKPFIIADVGSNWKRSKDQSLNLELALRHIDSAAQCGVSAVKFQLFSHLELYGVEGPNDYQLPESFIPKLYERCINRQVEFMCTAFSPEGVKFVDPYVKRHKIASAESYDLRIKDAIYQTGKPVVISLGGTSDGQWVTDKFKDLTILECVAAYPAETSDYNLSCLKTWKRAGTAIGVSDHTMTNTTALVAIGFGATVFEKHFDVLRINEPLKDSPDAPFALGPTQLKSYVSDIIEGFSALGDGVKKINASEEPMRIRWKRRIKATKYLKGGIDILEEGVNFGAYRSLEDDLKAAPASAILTFNGRRVKKDLKPQEGIWFDDIE